MNAIADVDKGKNLPTSSKHGLDTLRRPFWYDGDMLKGRCPKCGTYCIGWALRNPRHQTCPKCGAGLEITEDGERVFTGYSPFTAERYSVNLPTNVPPSRNKEKDSPAQNKHHRS
jgi:ribosomal protein S27AE